MGVFVPQLLGGEVHFHDTLNPAGSFAGRVKAAFSVIVLVPRMLTLCASGVERNYALIS